ncbi:MAG: flagellar motor protein MotB [Negativicutes bacterium]|nr:flagellar motor protein MotB [Negativicutes bacterium]
MAKKKKHAAHHEEHMDETWLIPYADLLTLLLALFIVLFAVSQSDQKKIDFMARAFISAFHGNVAVFDAMKARQYEENTEKETNKDSMENITGSTGLSKAIQQQQENNQLNNVQQAIREYIQKNNLSGDIESIMTAEGLLIRIKDNALFDTGKADIRPEGRKLGKELATLLSGIPQRVEVTGHTDNVPINNYDFPSNWELSARRAVNFMRYILEQNPGLQPERFSAAGYGEYRPVASNATVEGRSQNRRVEVLIQRTYR